MLNSMYSAVTGLNASNQRMSVIGDNIANVNTTAYKSSELSFESLINQSVGGYSGQEIGGGVLGGNLSYDWNQGTIQKTSNPYDMAIAGTGFFMVKDAAGKTSYTRDGEFSFDASGNLKTKSGLAVQGCAYANPPVNPPATPLVNIVISPAQYQDVTVDSNGVYWGTDVTTLAKIGLFQAVLCKTTDPSVMAKTNNNLYTKTTTDATDPLILGTPQMNGLGSVESSSLEASNVDIAKEFVNMIEAQRAFSANSKVITTSDEMLQELVSMKR
jgi:flagellar hook protein FlgE